VVGEVWHGREGCVFQWRMLANSSRVLMVRVGAGSLLNLVCMSELEAKFW
jgi:hypothetical protein